MIIIQIPNTLAVIEHSEGDPEYEVHVINNLPPNSPKLRIHCASGDNDLGYHDLNVNGSFSWIFQLNIIIGKTLFFCHFWWENKDIRFDVFHGKIGFCGDEKICAWIVKEDGFYKGYHLPPFKPNELEKKYSW
ncbi:hypothetical protein Leryth_023615 [Lithospermum erythrorhizon]|nr:hypothetical protein Leryth_023615 [Lithospermum erythrorhizon]